MARQRAAISQGTWTPPGQRKAEPLTFREFAEPWLATRDIAVRTREHYRYLLDKHVLPRWGDVALTMIAPADVREWHGREVKPTVRAHSYGLLRSILGTAEGDGVIPSNPCRIRGAGTAKTTKRIKAMTPEELGKLIEALPERYRMLAQLGCWASLRFGELAGLQRADVDVRAGVLHVRRGIVRTKAGLVEKSPKTEAGLRTVTIPPHLKGELRQHLRRHAGEGPTGWVFPARGGGPLSASAFQRVFGPAAQAAGRPDATPHVLRHTGQTFAAQKGANLRELMTRAGQVSPAAALRYLHDADKRQREIADALSTIVAEVPKSSGKTLIKRRPKGSRGPRSNGD